MRTFQNVSQRLSFKVFHCDIRPALLGDRDDLENPRMVELSDDRSFPSKSGGIHGSAFEFGVRQFKHDEIARLMVNCFEYRRHPAMFDEVRHLKAAVQDFTDLDLVAQAGQSYATSR